MLPLAESVRCMLRLLLRLSAPLLAGLLLRLSMLLRLLLELLLLLALLCPGEVPYVKSCRSLPLHMSAGVARSSC
jgi:hypothetical protein